MHYLNSSTNTNIERVHRDYQAFVIISGQKQIVYFAIAVFRQSFTDLNIFDLLALKTDKINLLFIVLTYKHFVATLKQPQEDDVLNLRTAINRKKFGIWEVFVIDLKNYKPISH